MVATNLQLIVTTITLTGVMSLANAAVSITSNTGGAAVCPGQELVLTCVAENTVALRWMVFSSLHGASFIEKTFTERSRLGAQDVGGFTFTLILNSNNQFKSLLMTEATQPLHNAVIECHSTSLTSSFTIKIESAPKIPANVSSTIQEFLSSSTRVEMTWNPPLNHNPQVDYYHYELMDRLNELVMTFGNTSNTSIIFEDLPYNHDMLFTLTAINCVGRSSPITYHINTVGCLYNDVFHSLQMSTNFSQAPGTNLSLSCVHNSSIQATITCQDDGRWEPNPLSLDSLCDINISDMGLNEVIEGSMTPKVTNGAVTVSNTVTDDNESKFAESSYIHKYIIVSVSASLLLIIGSSMLVIIVICVYQVRKRRRLALCINLERQYETVDEPVYEMVLPNVNPINEVWSECNTKYNEAYQKTGSPLHLYSELSDQ